MSYLTPQNSAKPASPAESLGRHLRWQVLLALVGALLLATLLGLSTYNMATVLVPDRGGVFREGVAGNVQNLNPFTCESSEADADLCALIYRGLTKSDRNGVVVPDLAESWEVSEGITYTFRLRQDQYWHDGEQVTVDDVLFTVGILQDPAVLSLPGLTGLWRTVTMEKLDDFTVRFVLAEPFTPFLDYTAMGLLPQHVWQGRPAVELATGPLNATPVGTGPLKAVQSAADHVRLEASPYYAGPQPYISALEFVFYPDHQSLFSAFTAGEIDGIRQLSPTDMEAASQREDLQLFSSVEPDYLNIVFNLRNPDAPFLQEKEVRQALMLGINREALVDEVLNGQGVVAHSMMPPENWAYNPNVRQYAYDPEEARRLLDSAGWVDSDGDGVRDKDGRPLQFLLHTNDDDVRMAVSQRVAQDWAALGVRAAPASMNFFNLVNDFLGPRRFEAALIGWELSGDPDPYPLWHSSQAEGGGQNYSGWANEEADALMEEARALVNGEERKQLYQRFQEIFADDLPALLLYHPVYTYGMSTRVHNVQVGAMNNPAERFATFADWYIVTRRVPVNQVPPSAPPTPPGGEQAQTSLGWQDLTGSGRNDIVTGVD